MQDDTCPSVAHVLDRIDGGLARVRVAGGRVRSAHLRAVADTAARFGNGTIEITNRANLQLRGVRDGAAAPLAAALEQVGASRGAAGDLRRNIMAGPLAGLDPAALADPTPIVDAIVAALDAEPRLDDLSPKCGVAVDGGGAFHLGGRRDDVVVTATAPDRWAVLVPGVPPRNIVSGDVAPAVRDALVASLDGPARPVGGRPMIVAPLPPGASSRVTVGPLGASPLTSGHPSAGDTTAAGWVGAMPMLGRADAATFAAIADLAEQYGEGVIRLTPWRGLVLGGIDRSAAAAVTDALVALGLLVDPGDPRTAVVACAGALGCPSGLTDAPGDARAVAAGRLDTGTGRLNVHVSGCEKRCAQRTPEAVTLLGTGPGRYDVLIADPDAPTGERCVATGLDRAAAIDRAAAARAPQAARTPVR